LADGIPNPLIYQSHDLPISQFTKYDQRMNILLWVLQVLLALAFLAHGWMLLFPPAAIAEQMNATMPRWFQLFLGVAEILAAVGLTLPGITRIQPRLISWAAAGIMVVMICATIFHVMRNEISSAVVTAVLLALATFVAYMRWRVAPIAPRRTVVRGSVS
jgi:uncharacterized membrane protein YphA (DoxX/SURF4 family)